MAYFYNHLSRASLKQKEGIESGRILQSSIINDDLCCTRIYFVYLLTKLNADNGIHLFECGANPTLKAAVRNEAASLG